MENVLRANTVKIDFEELKKRWDALLSKYFLDKTKLNPQYTMAVPCPYCKGSDVSRAFNLNGFYHKTCANCQTLYVSPRLKDEYIAEIYQDAYYNEVYVRSMLPVFDKRKALIGQRKYAQTVQHWGKGGAGNILDIGAGIGEVTDVFKDNGWETHAIEMNAVAVDWLKHRNHAEVFHGMLDDYETHEVFDIIMAWGVVEHVIDPDVFLQKVYRLLKPGGLFVSEVPHGQSLLVDMTEKTAVDPKRILMGEQHIVLYSTDAYIKLHERNGFQPVHLQTNGLDCDTIFKENKIDVSDTFLAALQTCIDEHLYGDLLRGFWRSNL